MVVENVVVLVCGVVLFLIFAGIKVAQAGQDAERFMKMLDIQEEDGE